MLVIEVDAKINRSDFFKNRSSARMTHKDIFASIFDVIRLEKPIKIEAN